MQRCIYCGYMSGNTKEHIIPRALLTDLRLYTHNNGLEQPEQNIAPCCAICNNMKANRVILPTPGYIATSFINTPSIYIRSIAEWVAFNKHDLLNFFENEQNREFYDVQIHEIETVVTLYWKDYYEKLSDVKRNIPNNEFKRENISINQQRA